MTKTIVGLFDEYREAQRAVVELVESGISREDIGITSRDYADYDETDTRRADSYRDDEGVGGTVVTVDCDSEEMADRAEAILNRFGGDVDERGESHRQGAYMGTDNVETNRTEGGEARIPVIEEELRV